MNTTKPIARSDVGFAGSVTNSAIIRDDDPSALRDDRYPVHILPWKDSAQWITATGNDIVAQAHQRQPDAGEVLVDEEPHLVPCWLVWSKRSWQRAHAMRRWERS